jgi:hypothetical protein
VCDHIFYPPISFAIPFTDHFFFASTFNPPVVFRFQKGSTTRSSSVLLHIIARTYSQTSSMSSESGFSAALTARNCVKATDKSRTQKLSFLMLSTVMLMISFAGVWRFGYGVLR